MKYEPHFNGADYQKERDFSRLSTQIERVFSCMKDGNWRTLGEIATTTNDPEASVSAQVRHLRKARFGSHTVTRQYISSGLYKYQLVPAEQELPGEC